MNNPNTSIAPILSDICLRIMSFDLFSNPSADALKLLYQIRYFLKYSLFHL